MTLFSRDRRPNPPGLRRDIDEKKQINQCVTIKAKGEEFFSHLGLPQQHISPKKLFLIAVLNTQLNERSLGNALSKVLCPET